MSDIETVIAILVIMVYSVGRQIAGEPLRAKRLIGLPAALTVIGIVDVANSNGPGPTRLDIVLIIAGCVVNALIGLGQGRLMRLESRDGFLWGQMPKSVLWWWGAKIASGVVLDGIGHALGAGLAVTTAAMLLRLGVNRLGQAAMVAPRACQRYPLRARTDQAELGYVPNRAVVVGHGPLGRRCEPTELAVLRRRPSTSPRIRSTSGTAWR